jgi:hypothetical protein
MKKLTDEQIEFIVQRLKEGKPLPDEFKWLLFEGKQEAELGYFGKERDIDIITETKYINHAQEYRCGGSHLEIRS